MRVKTTPITCNNIIITQKTLIPESFSEKLIGLRGQVLDQGSAMLFVVSNPFLELFDTFFCNTMGCIAMDETGLVLQKGVMQPNKIKLIHCFYWLEVPPNMIEYVCIGDRLQGIYVKP